MENLSRAEPIGSTPLSYVESFSLLGLEGPNKVEAKMLTAANNTEMVSMRNIGIYESIIEANIDFFYYNFNEKFIFAF